MQLTPASCALLRSPAQLHHALVYRRIWCGLLHADSGHYRHWPDAGSPDLFYTAAGAYQPPALPLNRNTILVLVDDFPLPLRTRRCFCLGWFLATTFTRTYAHTFCSGSVADATTRTQNAVCTPHLHTLLRYLPTRRHTFAQHTLFHGCYFLRDIAPGGCYSTAPSAIPTRTVALAAARFCL